MNLYNQPEEARLVRNVAVRYLTERYDFQQRQASLLDDNSLGTETWRDFAAMGWLGLPMPEVYGGGGGGMSDVSILLRTFGEFLVTEPYLSTVILGTRALLDATDEAIRQELLPQIRSGELQIAIALAEPRSGYNHLAIETKAQSTASGVRINGHKAMVLGAPEADMFVISANTRAGPGLFLVAADADGISIRPYRLVDGRAAAEIRLEQVSARALTEAGAKTVVALERLVRCGAVAILAEAAGVAEAAVTVTAKYLNVREQFGLKLADFQALRHRVARMFVHKEELSALASQASVDYDGKPDSNDTRESIAAGKIYLGQQGRAICEEAVQLHGAIAVTDEYVVGHYLKRMISLNHLFGNAEFHLATFMQGSHVLDGAADSSLSHVDS